MKPILALALMLLGLTFAAPASAQVRLEFGPQYEEDYPPPRAYGRRYRDPYEQRGYDRYEPGYGGGYGRPVYGRRALGYMCVTSRGTCELGSPAPIDAGCRCHIPGFGRKRGNVR